MRTLKEYWAVWVCTWAVAWIFGALQMICEWTLFPLLLIVCSPVLILHSALFGDFQISEPCCSLSATIFMTCQSWIKR